MIKWFCSICGEPADYHAADSHGNKYYCTKHWWNHVQQIDGVDIHGVVADSCAINKDSKECIGQSSFKPCEIQHEDKMKELLIGCGSRKVKELYVSGKKEFENLTTIDINGDHHPDFVWDLRKHPMLFKDEEFDEIHAYDVLEHLAYQGDYEFFFREFTEYHRILKPGGLFFGKCPSLDSKWLWSDPSHKRVVSRETLVFLDQDEYKKQVGVTKMSDFRYLYKVSFKTEFAQDKDGSFNFILKKC